MHSSGFFSALAAACVCVPCVFLVHTLNTNYLLLRIDSVFRVVGDHTHTKNVVLKLIQQKVKIMPSRQHSRGGFDYASSTYARMAYPYQHYPYQQPYYGYQAQHPGYSGAYLNGYGSGYSHAYGADGYHHYMRSHDPNYESFSSDGPSVDDKWRSTYPYVPTSYSQQSKHWKKMFISRLIFFKDKKKTLRRKGIVL